MKRPSSRRTRCRWPTKPTRRSRRGTASSRPVRSSWKCSRSTTTLRCGRMGLPGLVGALGACFGRVIGDGLAARAGARRVQLAGDAVARDRARVHAAGVEVQGAALADRRHLGLRGTPAPASLGPGVGARVRESVFAGKDLRREGPARRVQATGEPGARVLRGVARRRAPGGRERRRWSPNAAAGVCRRRVGHGGLREGVRASRSTPSTRPSRRLSISVTAPWQSDGDAAGTSSQRVGRAEARATAAPDNFISQLTLGQALMKAGDFSGARAPLERAATLAPQASGDGSPRALLAEIAERTAIRRVPRRELRLLLEHDHANVMAARRLVELSSAAPAGDATAVDNRDFGLRLVADLDPLDADDTRAAWVAACSRRKRPLTTPPRSSSFRRRWRSGPPTSPRRTPTCPTCCCGSDGKRKPRRRRSRRCGWRRLCAGSGPAAGCDWTRVGMTTSPARTVHLLVALAMGFGALVIWSSSGLAAAPPAEQGTRFASIIQGASGDPAVRDAPPGLAGPARGDLAREGSSSTPRT